MEAWQKYHITVECYVSENFIRKKTNACFMTPAKYRKLKSRLFKIQTHKYCC